MGGAKVAVVAAAVGVDAWVLVWVPRGVCVKPYDVHELTPRFIFSVSSRMNSASMNVVVCGQDGVEGRG